MSAASDRSTPRTEIAVFGAGCFWCIEAALEQMRGVSDVVSGYMGGASENPTYREICGGNSGHAEVVQATFDPDVTRFENLLEGFWKVHDPTTLNRQGADVGTQYRSAIFVHSPTQREIAERSKATIQRVCKDPVVTEISDASTFWPAEAEHQDYYRNNKSAGYCRVMIRPKLEQLGLDP